MKYKKLEDLTTEFVVQKLEEKINQYEKLEGKIPWGMLPDEIKNSKEFRKGLDDMVEDYPKMIDSATKPRKEACEDFLKVSEAMMNDIGEKLKVKNSHESNIKFIFKLAMMEFVYTLAAAGLFVEQGKDVEKEGPIYDEAGTRQINVGEGNSKPAKDTKGN